MAEIISSLKFEELVRDEKLPLLIDVYGAGCAPCAEIAPVIDELAQELKGRVRIVKLDRDEARQNGGEQNPALRFIAEQGIRGIPALMLFEEGEYKGVLMGGPRPRSNILEWMEETLGRKLSFKPASGSIKTPKI